MPKNLIDIQQEVDIFLKERGWFPDDKEGRYYTTLHMVEEVGEVSRCISLLESKRGIWLDTDHQRTKEDLVKELGDVLFHVVKIASAYGIDVSQAFEKTMAKNRDKFPIEKFKR